MLDRRMGRRTAVAALSGAMLAATPVTLGRVKAQDAKPFEGVNVTVSGPALASSIWRCSATVRWSW